MIGFKKNKRKEILCDPKSTRIHIAEYEISVETLIFCYAAQTTNPELSQAEVPELIKISMNK
jgi:hypothetical protein